MAIEYGISKTRILVMTDISTIDAQHGEPDDTQSLIRLLMYSNMFTIEGFIVTYTSHGKTVFPDCLRHIIVKYGEVRANLLRFYSDFPDSQYLLQKIYVGSALPGLEQMINGCDTEGSEKIIEIVDNSVEPLWILAWGGVTDLARAIRKAENEKSQALFSSWLNKIRVYTISDQYDDCGPWIRNKYPSLFYITNYHAFRGMYRGGDSTFCNTAWVEHNISQKGPLGKAYPVYKGGDIYSNFLGKIQGVKEGDTPSFLYLLTNGPGEKTCPEHGGWGGRFTQKPGTNHYFDVSDNSSWDCGELISISRFREVFQNDFASRMSWCLPDTEVQVYPEIIVTCNKNELKCGEKVILSFQTDYTGDLSCQWRRYPDAGTYKGTLFIKELSKNDSEVILARNPSMSGDIHIILTVSTMGKNPLYLCKRIVLNVVNE